ncbi:MAG: hypothetical protein ACRDBT_02185 [Aeromonas sp.]
MRPSSGTARLAHSAYPVTLVGNQSPVRHLAPIHQDPINQKGARGLMPVS